MFHQYFLLNSSPFVSALHLPLRHVHFVQHTQPWGTNVCEKYTHHSQAKLACCPAKLRLVTSQEDWKFRVSEGMLCQGKSQVWLVQGAKYILRNKTRFGLGFFELFNGVKQSVLTTSFCVCFNRGIFGVSLWLTQQMFSILGKCVRQIGNTFSQICQSAIIENTELQID